MSKMPSFGVVEVGHGGQHGGSGVIKFQIGDEVRVIGLPASEWHGMAGVVVNTMERPAVDEREPTQECAVQFPSCRRWFLSGDLVRTIPDRALRFFRSEALERWTQLSPDDVIALNGTREELIAFLQERYGFALKRATRETDDFIAHVESRMNAAMQPHKSPGALSISA
jgi:hypothetical protein